MLDIKKISVMRKIKGLTQQELAEKAGISQSLIARIEKGTVDPAFSKVEKIFSILEREQHESNVIAEQIMTKNISSLSPLRSLASTMSVMNKKNISQLPVIDNNIVVGTITEKGIAHAFVMNDDPSSLKVKDVMENPMPSIDVSTSLSVISSMLDAQSAVLVTKNGKIKGIVARADLLKVVKRSV